MCQPVINCDHVMSRFALTDLEGSLRVCVCVCVGGDVLYCMCLFEDHALFNKPFNNI